LFAISGPEIVSRILLRRLERQVEAMNVKASLLPEKCAEPAQVIDIGDELRAVAFLTLFNAP